MIISIFSSFQLAVSQKSMIFRLILPVVKGSPFTSGVLGYARA